MAEHDLEIETERVDDVPLLLAQQVGMGIPDVLNQIASPHGNRRGLSVGWLAASWLSYIVSRADHRLSEVEPWAGACLSLLSRVIPEPVCRKDFTDDRLADLLRWLAEDEVWATVEREVGTRLVGVYQLDRRLVRLDSTSVSVYHDAEESTLFGYGHSKDHRPDLAQFKVMLATLDPLGLPVATLVVPGEQADDPLYVPAIQAARPVVGQGGLLYVGDAKMSALSTRAFVALGGDYYLTPLPLSGEVPALLSELVAAGDQLALTRVEDPPAGPDAEPALLASGFETTRSLQAAWEATPVSWQERVLVVHSPGHAKRQHQNLTERVARAQQSLVALTAPRARGRRQWTDYSSLEAAVAAILKRERVEGLLKVDYQWETERRWVRAYGERPARVEHRGRFVLQVEPDEAAIAAAGRLFGWRLYVTNAPREQLSLADAVRAYRSSHHIEHGFSRLKGRPLGIRPVYLQREAHVRGLARLLSLALRLLTVMEYVVRKRLAGTGEVLRGLYAGNPMRPAVRPTAERLLRAFRGITLTVVRLPDQTVRHVTPLSQLQRRILDLLDLPVAIYDDLALSTTRIPP